PYTTLFRSLATLPLKTDALSMLGPLVAVKSIVLLSQPYRKKFVQLEVVENEPFHQRNQCVRRSAPVRPTARRGGAAMTGESTALVAALPMAAVLVDPSGWIAAANAAAEALFGMSLAGRHHVAALRQPDLLDALAAVLSGGESRATRFRHRDGSRDLIFRVSVSPAALGPRASALAVFEDETSVEAADQMRRDFVANVSHELKTPLTALLGFVETLRTTARDDPEARERFLAIMA